MAKVEVTQFTRFQQVGNAARALALLQPGKLCGIETSQHQNGNRIAEITKEVAFKPTEPITETALNFATRTEFLLRADFGTHIPVVGSWKITLQRFPV